MMPSKPLRTAHAINTARYDDPDRVVDDVDSDESTGKDATELELERLVFDDDASFYEGLRLHKNAGHTSEQISTDATGEDNQSVQEQDGGLEGVDDADVR